MKRKFFILILIHLSLQAGHNWKLSDKQEEEIHKWMEEKRETQHKNEPCLFSINGRYFPLTDRDDLVVPLEAVDQLLKKQGRNVCTLLRNRQRGITNVPGTNLTECALIGSNQCVSAFRGQYCLYIAPWGPINSYLVGLMRQYICASTKEEKRRLAFSIAGIGEAVQPNNVISIQRWFERASFYGSLPGSFHALRLYNQALDQNHSGHSENQKSGEKRKLIEGYLGLVKQGHKPSILALAKLDVPFERIVKLFFDQPLHKISQYAVSEFLDFLKESLKRRDLIENGETPEPGKPVAPEDSIEIDTIAKKLLPLCKTVKTQNELINVMQIHNLVLCQEPVEYDTRMRLYFEFFCKNNPEHVTDKSLLRLALLTENPELQYNRFLDAAKGGNPLAMIEVVCRSKDSLERQLWFNRLKNFKNDILWRAAIEDYLRHLAYVGDLTNYAYQRQENLPWMLFRKGCVSFGFSEYEILAKLKDKPYEFSHNIRSRFSATENLSLPVASLSTAVDKKRGRKEEWADDAPACKRPKNEKSELE